VRRLNGFPVIYLVCACLGLALALALLGSVRVSAQDAVPTPTLLPVQETAFDLGIHIRETQPNIPEEVMAGYLDAARNQLNLNWVRAQIRWDFIETEPENYNWANWDTFFRLAAEQDLKVLVTVTGSPSWAQYPETAPNVIAPPQDSALFALFIGNLLRRYPNQIHAVEVWQNMNVRSHWVSPDGLNPAGYVRMMTFVTSIIRKVDPNIIIISGGLKATADSADGSSVDDFRYLDGLLEAGLTNYVDCIGVQHQGYNISPGVAFDAVPPDENAVFRGPFDNPHHSWSFASTLNTYARKLAAAGYPTPLCVTEFGWASSEDLPRTPSNLPFAADNTLAEQNAWLVEAVRLMQEWGFVRLAFIWNLNVSAESGFNPESANAPYSLIRPGYAVAPAWQSIADMNFRGQPR